jgi:lysine N6-hydroxylase
MGSYRNAIILKAVLGYAPYSIEEHIAFQTFDPALCSHKQPCGASAINTLCQATTQDKGQMSQAKNHTTASPLNLYPAKASNAAGASMSSLMAPHKEAQ